MIELTRFQQLRRVQKISVEETKQIGLFLYPDDKLSDLANALRAAAGSDEYATLINADREAGQQVEMTDLKAVNPAIVALYEWLNLKARPIKIADFRAFVATLKAGALPSLDTQWRLYADALVVAIARQVLHTNSCVDFQLLIRICWLIRRCLIAGDQTPGNQGYTVKADVTPDLINQILALPILLPARLLVDRCAEACRQPDKPESPAAETPERDLREPLCECSCNTDCQKPSKFCLCLKPYIGDLFLIKEELARFESGDLADIENILAGEKKLRRHRTLLRSETTSETDNETVTSEERDHEVNEKFNLQSEVKKATAQKVGVDAGVTATLKYGNSVTITPHANVTADFSKSQSQNLARSYAKDVVDRAVSNVQERVRTLQISKVLSEVAEKNEDAIDNSFPGASHRAGLYYWVNKVSHAQVYSYGKHMMFDIIVPEPAATFKALYNLKIGNDNSTLMEQRPKITPQEITRDNYGTWLQKYGIAVSDQEVQPLDQTVCVQLPFSQYLAGPTDKSTQAFSSTDDFKVDIPDGYMAKKMDYDVRCSIGHPGSTDEKDQVAISVNVGNTALMFESLNEYVQDNQSNQDWVQIDTKALNGEQGSVTVAIAGFSSLALMLSGSLSITCVLTDESYAKWQVLIYTLIMSDYNRKLDAYNAANSQNVSLTQIKGRNPFLNREIERNEFKRSIIAVLMCNYFNGIGSMMERVEPCGYPEINFEQLDKDAPFIQFFEQVFEWEYMTYLFYHSMWARKCKWADLINEDSGDPLFDKFLMSGAARVQVPIRPGLESEFNWFLRTNQVWNASGQPPVAGDDDYVAMIQELKEAEQGDYSDRPGLIQAVEGSDTLVLTGSAFYWDDIQGTLGTLAVNNDIDRELLVNFKVYRIVSINQANSLNTTTWSIVIDPPYPDASATNMKHAVGAVFVGTPWEVVVPTELVYLRNPQDTLPTYPLT